MNKTQIYKLRQTLGLLGILLPIIDFIGLLIHKYDFTIINTISATYYTESNTFFTGILFAIGVCMIFYWYDDIKDRVLTTITGICAFGIAIFPTAAEHFPRYNFFNVPMLATQILHCTFALVFFGILTYIQLALFTKSNGVMTKEKQKRNLVYKICGITMPVAILVGGAINVFVPKLSWMLFVGETLGLWTFGISWLVKGEFVLKDKYIKEYKI